MKEVYLNRAEQLARARELMREDDLFASATALLSVHSAIAMTDALLLTLTGARSKEQNHSRAAELLEQACSSKKIESKGVKHLRALLSAKTDVSYGDKNVTKEKALILAKASEQFDLWAFRALKEIR